MEGKSLSNFEIEIIIENSSNDDLKNNIVDVFPSNKMNCFISFHGLIKEKSEPKYPFFSFEYRQSW